MLNIDIFIKAAIFITAFIFSWLVLLLLRLAHQFAF